MFRMRKKQRDRFGYAREADARRNARCAGENFATLGRISPAPERAHGSAVLRMIRHRRHWALHLLMLCALAAVITRALIPTGYMAVADGDRISVTLCG